MELLLDFLNEYLELPFGSRTKLETELLIFSALVDRGDIDPNASSFGIATKLRISKSKAKALIYAYQIRKTPSLSAEFIGIKFTPQLVQCFESCKFVLEGQFLLMTVENQLAREALQDELEKLDFIVEFGQNRNVLKFTPEALFVLVGKFELLMSEARFSNLYDNLNRPQIDLLKSEYQKNKDRILGIFESGAKVFGVSHVFEGLRGLLAGFKKLI
jgi:hypothetical protein